MIDLPRARIGTGERQTEWQSGLIERYQRRGVGGSSAFGLLFKRREGRRSRGALAPLLVGHRYRRAQFQGGEFEALFTQWRSRSLASEGVVFLYLDTIALRVRIANKVISGPVLVGLGVKEDGEKVILDLELFQSEWSSCWEGFLEGLISRGLKPPS